MNKSQYLGILRAFLTSLGAVLVTFGVTDGHAFLPIVGIVLSLVSLGWGVLWHRDPHKPGKIQWSLIRKFCNAVTSALATYGFLHPGQVSGVMMLVATLGPLLAVHLSFIDNSPEQPEEDSDDLPPQR